MLSGGQRPPRVACGHTDYHLQMETLPAARIKCISLGNLASSRYGDMLWHSPHPSSQTVLPPASPTQSSNAPPPRPGRRGPHTPITGYARLPPASGCLSLQVRCLPPHPIPSWEGLKANASGFACKNLARSKTLLTGPFRLYRGHWLSTCVRVSRAVPHTQAVGSSMLNCW